MKIESAGERRLCGSPLQGQSGVTRQVRLRAHRSQWLLHFRGLYADTQDVNRTNIPGGVNDIFYTH